MEGKTLFNCQFNGIFLKQCIEYIKQYIIAHIELLSVFIQWRINYFDFKCYTTAATPCFIFYTTQCWTKSYKAPLLSHSHCKLLSLPHTHIHTERRAQLTCSHVRSKRKSKNKTTRLNCKQTQEVAEATAAEVAEPEAATTAAAIAFTLALPLCL